MERAAGQWRLWPPGLQAAVSRSCLRLRTQPASLLLAPPHSLCAQAILSKQRAETLSSVLYPDDRSYAGKELRLTQQHFFVSATVQARSWVWERAALGAGTAAADGGAAWMQQCMCGPPCQLSQYHNSPLH